MSHIKKEDINFDKLPKKVREYINDIERERTAAINALNEYIDDQTESPFSYSDFLCTGEDEGSPVFKIKYIQTHKMEIKHAGIDLSILLREDIIELQWSSLNHGMRHIALIPSSFQSAHLVSKDNMD